MKLEYYCGGLDLGPAHPIFGLTKELAHNDLLQLRACLPKGGERQALTCFWIEMSVHGWGWN